MGLSVVRRSRPYVNGCGCSCLATSRRGRHGVHDEEEGRIQTWEESSAPTMNRSMTPGRTLDIQPLDESGLPCFVGDRRSERRSWPSEISSGGGHRCADDTRDVATLNSLSVHVVGSGPLSVMVFVLNQRSGTLGAPPMHHGDQLSRKGG